MFHGYDWKVTRRAVVVGAPTLIQRFAMSGDYALEKLGARFYLEAGRSLDSQELVALVQKALMEQAGTMSPFMTGILQRRAGEVVAKLVDDPVVAATAAETFEAIAAAQRAVGTPSTVDQTVADLAVSGL